jgi:hypothetical protein
MKTSGITAAQALIHVTDVRAAVEEMRGRGVEFEEYDTRIGMHDRALAWPPASWKAGSKASTMC